MGVIHNNLVQQSNIKTKKHIMDKQITNAFLIQLIGNTWESDMDNLSYSFLPESLNKKISDDPDLFIHDKTRNKYYLTKYILYVKNGYCYLQFMSKTYHILEIRNDTKPYLMKLKDEEFVDKP